MRRQLSLFAAALLVSAGLSTPSANAIIGGATTDPPPWMVAVSSPGMLLRPSGQFCGGTLVRPDKVVTAAHCVNLLKLTPWAVRGIFGRADLHGKGGETVTVKKIWVHPGFKETKFQGDSVEHNDVAVLTLSRAVNRTTLPLIDAGAEYPAGAPAEVLGWGATSESNDSNAVLRKADLPIVADSTCASAYGGSFVSAQMVCAGTPQADTCEYDSGGPLVLQGKLAGLTSWAHGCAREGFPGVYTRLSAFTLPL
ncbi:serine protease [Kribbella yunnanensis]|uniref:Serine protease n=1 Tax=Kribbella yunnanensis TaxID=190194 RepID=A0ABN2I6R1_9ACTN